MFYTIHHQSIINPYYLSTVDIICSILSSISREIKCSIILLSLYKFMFYTFYHQYTWMFILKSRMEMLGWSQKYFKLLYHYLNHVSCHEKSQKLSIFCHFNNVIIIYTPLLCIKLQHRIKRLMNYVLKDNFLKIRMKNLISISIRFSIVYI